MLVSQTLIFGAFSVLVIVLAVDRLGTGDAGVGYLNAAIGVGAFIGAGAAARPGRQPPPRRAAWGWGWRSGGR